MRYIKYAFIAAFGIALITVALANRTMVQIQLLPEELSGLLGLAPKTEMPLFLVIFGGIVVGIIVGFVWEWLREHTHRSSASKSARDVRRLEREIKKLKGEKNAGKDEVLAILDDAA